MSNLDERIFFFEGSRKRSLLGFLHVPLAHRKSSGVIYCHPFADEQSLSHRVAVETSRKIAESGFPVLRFDFSGCGDSQGELIDVNLIDWLADLNAAIKYVKAALDVDKVILWGLRLGASIALLHSLNKNDINSLILWQPVTDISNYFNQIIKREFFSQLTENPTHDISITAAFNELQKKGEINVIGYTISKQFLDSFQAFSRNTNYFKTYVSNCVVISISLMEISSPVFHKFKDELLSKGINSELIHVKTDSFWNQYWRWSCPELTEKTISWLQRHTK